MPEETRYMISDTAKKVAVEAHVLRYWEEELALPIGRTELGHRYYTEENIRVFLKIKELKERGFQLKAIKVLIPEIEKKEIHSTDNIIHLEEKLSGRVTCGETGFSENAKDEPECSTECSSECPEEMLADEKTTEKEKVDLVETALSKLDINVDKLVQFEKIVGNIVATALKENNRELNEQLSDSVVKEMDTLMRIREEREEERFRRLDEAIRAHQNQKPKKLVAAAREEEGRARKGIFFWRH